jgi:mevalonate kinase
MIFLYSPIIIARLMKMTGYGYGKVILFGEHFVVYGLPGIAGGIQNKTTAEIEKADKPGLHVVDNRPTVEGYKEGKAEQFKESLEYIKAAIPQVAWDAQGVKVTLGGDLVAASGVGASAASCAAIARAVSDFFDLGLGDEQINKIAYEGEKGYHGSPSGLDNTCATYGTLITFKRDPDGNIIEKLDLENTVEVVMANTGIPVDTKAIVAGVRERKESSPEEYEKIFEDYQKTYGDALSALKNGDWKKVGKLMDQNQELLRKIGVSHPKLEELINVAKENGAYGAKLTGGGAGGYMVALTPGKELQGKVAAALGEKVDIIVKSTIGGK